MKTNDDDRKPNDGRLVLPIDVDQVEPGAMVLSFNPKTGKLLLKIPGFCRIKAIGVRQLDLSDANEPQLQPAYADDNGFPLRLPLRLVRSA